MYDLLKLLNDHSAGDLAELDNNELQRFETLSENWRKLVEAERARHKPHQRRTNPATVVSPQPCKRSPQMRSCQRASRSEAMYDLLKLLNDRSAGDLAELDRISLPRPIAGTRVNTSSKSQ